MDGNGRWAEERGLPRSAGHREGAQALKRIIPACIDLAIPFLTVYAFSMENWKRPKREISFLFSLLKRHIRSETPVLKKEGVAVGVIGDLDAFPADLRKSMKQAVEATAGGSRLRLTIALGYGARQDIAAAAREIARKAVSGEIQPSAVDIRLFEEHLSTAGLPPVDLLIRTGGEQRISNFLLYEVSYAELYFTGKYWPDFGKDDMAAAVAEFGRRGRRFGGLREEDRRA
ncbi:MAG TPA: di-trans,poly-cis-decaprenylcistransferase [Planctomycetes bacterium]|nr:di-trans,poly-cis-decaprenylcistransferase [Planctomycetota bacterium]